MSRHSSPDNDFVDIESTERPHSSASGTSQKHGPQIIAALPEVKRNRGRPRKMKENVEEGKCDGSHCHPIENVSVCNSYFVYKVAYKINLL